VIIVDTNIISDVIGPRPTPSVFDWLRNQPVDDIWTTAITAAELRAGVAALIDGRRKRMLGEAVEQALYVDFSGRILPFDDAASVAYASISAARRRLGRNVGELDMQIAAIAVVRGATVATRNVTHFDESGVNLVNPWEA